MAQKRNPQHVQRALSRRRKNPNATRLRSRYRGGEWCAAFDGGNAKTKVCAVGARYGFIVDWHGQGGKSKLPVHVPRSDGSPQTAIKSGAAWINEGRRRQGIPTMKLGPIKRVR